MRHPSRCWKWRVRWLSLDVWKGLIVYRSCKKGRRCWFVSSFRSYFCIVKLLILQTSQLMLLKEVEWWMQLLFVKSLIKRRKGLRSECGLECQKNICKTCQCFDTCDFGTKSSSSIRLRFFQFKLRFWRIKNAEPKVPNFSMLGKQSSGWGSGFVSPNLDHPWPRSTGMTTIVGSV